jgi:membrane protein DedA with SNARE-associated domain
MAEFVKNLMSYPGIFFLMFLENVFPPLPSELIMPLAGYQAGQGKLTLVGAILAGWLGSLVGQLPLYYLGKVVGYERLKDWADKHGEWLTVSGEEVHKAKDWFDNHGNKAVVLGRLVPGIRSLVSIPAGFAHMPIGKFLAYSAVGTGIWTAALAWLGSLLGQNYGAIDKYLGPATYVVLGAITLYFVVSVIKRKKQRKQQGGEEQRREAHV